MGRFLWLYLTFWCSLECGSQMLMCPARPQPAIVFPLLLALFFPSLFKWTWGRRPCVGVCVPPGSRLWSWLAEVSTLTTHPRVLLPSRSWHLQGSGQPSTGSVLTSVPRGSEIPSVESD